MLQPLLTMVVFTVLFGKLAHVPSDGVPYPIFAYAGLVPWQFFQSAVSQSGEQPDRKRASSSPRSIFRAWSFPVRAVGAALVDFAIARGDPVR